MPDLFGYDRYGGLARTAELSECGEYRWWLRRSWKYGGDGRVVCFVMLNPSTADALKDDPTIRRCMGFARSWGFSALSVRNLFAYRATDPKQLLTATNPHGGERGDVELLTALSAHVVIAAWGSSVPLHRDRWFLDQRLAFYPDKPLYCLGTTKSGKPRHPLYVKAATQYRLFEH